MPWFHLPNAPRPQGDQNEIPDELWIQCKNCQTFLVREFFYKEARVCENCSFHHIFPPRERLNWLLDHNSFQEEDSHLISCDPLNFVDQKPYALRIKESQDSSHSQEAFLWGLGSIGEYPVAVGAMDFQFMGGSMGAVVGEKIARLLQRCIKDGLPAILISSSGGARMQEGLLSLMQMAKICMTLDLMKKEGLPMISLLTNPTMGGVAASYALQGDIHLAEPGSRIGFAGPRVIQETLGEKLPKDFQKAETWVKLGMIDQICHRRDQKSLLTLLLSLLKRSY